MKKVIFALQTARGGSKSVPNKNKLLVNGSPLFLHNALQAKSCKHIKDVYITTDDEDIKQIGSANGCKIINRCESLSKDDASHYEVIKDGLRTIETNEKAQLDYLVILLGNNCHAFSIHLQEAIEMLDGIKADSIISVSRYNMFHPYRAYTQTRNGYLQPYISEEIIRNAKKDNDLPTNDKNAFAPAYFFNGSFWIVRRAAFMNNDGFPPFPWLGKSIYAYIQHEGVMELDAPWQLPLFGFTHE